MSTQPLDPALDLDPPADALVDLPPTIPDAHHPINNSVDDDDYSDDNIGDDLVWSLRSVLQRRLPGAPAQATVVEVIHTRGERVLDYRVLNVGDAHGAVRFVARGRAVINISGNLGDDVDLTLDGALYEKDGEVVAVRYAPSASVLWTAALVAEERARRMANVVSSAAGALLMSICGVVVWLGEYRGPTEITSHTGDDDGIVPEPPMPVMDLPKPKPKPEPKPPVEPPKLAARDRPTPPTKQPPQPSKQPSPSPSPAPAPSPTSSVMDVLGKMPTVKGNSVAADAASHIKDAVKAPGTFHASNLAGHGPHTQDPIEGTGPETFVTHDALAKAGAMGRGGTGEHEVRAEVTKALRKDIVKKGGEYPLEEIQRVVGEHVGQVQYCYEKSLQRYPGSGGRVVLEWTIGPDGNVTMAKQNTSQLPSAEAVSCMLSKLRAWKFAKPSSGSVTVTYPFVFSQI